MVSETCTVTVWSACTRPRATFWPATMITPGLEARRWTRGLGRRPRHRPDRTSLLQPGGLIVGQRVRSAAEQLAGLEAEEQQRAAVLDIDPDPAAGEDFRGQHRLPAQPTIPFRATVRSTSNTVLDDRLPGPPVRHRRNLGGRLSSLRHQGVQSPTLNRERSDFTRSPPIDRCTHSQSTENRTT